MLVRYYKLYSERNGGIIVVYGNWPGSAMKSRGWTQKRMFYQREATTQEMAELSGALRYMSIRYTSLDSLLRDELEILSVADVEKLREAAVLLLENRLNN